MKKRIETLADGVTLHLGDCLDILPTLPKHDALVTDPPYCIGTTSNGKQGEWLDNNLIQPFFKIFFDLAKDCLSDDGDFYISTDWRTYPFLYPIIVQRMRVTNCIVWDFEWIKAGSHYRFSHEFIIYGQKLAGRKRKFSATERDVWRAPPMNFTRANKDHQSEKPLHLIERMIANSTNRGESALDPFMGSGTTGVAAVKMGRKFTGIEISEKYFDIACRRIQDALDRPDMLIEAEAKPTQIGLI